MHQAVEQILEKRIRRTMDALRAAADSLETIVSRKVWPIPTYADILVYE